MNHQQFIREVIPFKDKLFRLAKRLLVSREEAEDATQEVLLKLWSKNKELSEVNSVEAFAMTMTKNFCLDRLKSKQASNLKLVHSNYSAGDKNQAQRLEQTDAVSWVEKLMQELPEQQQMVLQLRDVEGYELEEIGIMLQLQPNNVRVTLSRARKTIREKLIQVHKYGLG